MGRSNDLERATQGETSMDKVSMDKVSMNRVRYGRVATRVTLMLMAVAALGAPKKW